MLAFNQNETIKIAQKVFKRIITASSHSPAIALIGDLGSGKTFFVKCVARELEIKENVVSPTFNILKVYKVSDCNYPNVKIQQLCHIDAYRLPSSRDLLDLGVAEYFNDPYTLTIIEWADKVREILPKDTIYVNFKVTGKNTRQIIINS